MKQELYNLIEQCVLLETKNNVEIKNGYMLISLPKNEWAKLTIKKCSNFIPTNHYTTNLINRKIGYGKNNPHYNKIMLKNVKELQYYILDALNTILNLGIKFLFLQKSSNFLELYYSV